MSKHFFLQIFVMPLKGISEKRILFEHPVYAIMIRLTSTIRLVEKQKTINVDEKYELLYVESGLKPANVYDRYRSKNFDGKYWPP